MNVRRAFFLVLVAALLLPFFSCSGSSGHGGPPVISTIPLQYGSSGFEVSLDLGSYIADPDTADSTLTLTETSSWGGTFSGTTYTNTFDTMGTYEVTFKAVDPGGKYSTGSFQVQLNKGVLFVYHVSNDLRYVDGGTGYVKDFSGNDGYAETWSGTLSDGKIVFKRTVGSQDDLYVYDPVTGVLETVAADSTETETYAGGTSYGAILYSKGPAGSRDLYLYDPSTDQTTTVSDNTLDDLNPNVGSGDDVYFERASATGQKDIWHYDTGTGELKNVTASTYDEGIDRTLPNGNLVYWRLNVNGTKDLYYYTTGGNSYTICAGSEEDAVVGNTSSSHVLYTKGGAGLYVFNVSTMASSTIESSGTVTYKTSMGSGDYVIYELSGALYAYRISTGTKTTVAAATAGYQGKLSDDATLVYSRSNDLFTYVLSTGTAVNISNTSGVSSSFDAVLSNDDIVFTESGALKYWDYSASSKVDVSTSGGTETYKGDMGGGKFCFATSGGSGDLYIWDTEAGSAATVSNDAAADTYLACGHVARTTTTVTTDTAAHTKTTVKKVSTKRVVLFSRGATPDLYTFTLTTEVTTTTVEDTSTGTVTSGPTTTTTTTADSAPTRVTETASSSETYVTTVTVE